MDTEVAMKIEQMTIMEAVETRKISKYRRKIE